ncbi:MAG: VWA domain-containing protein [bacterium]
MNSRYCILVFLCLWYTLGCTKFNPQRSSPAANIAGIRGSVTSIASGRHPFIEILIKIEGTVSGGIYAPIIDFKKSNFAVIENNGPVILTDISYSRAPISAILVLDRSGSMWGDPHANLNAAVIGFIDGLLGIDEVEIIDFGDSVTIKQAFTNNKDELKDAVNSSESDMLATAVWAGTGIALEETQKASSKNVLLIVMTDGYDNYSEEISSDYPSVEAVIAYAKSIGQAVHTVGYSSSDDDLESLALETGGTYNYADTAAALITIYGGFIPSEVNHTILHYRTRESGSKKVEIYLNYGPFNQLFTSNY